MTVEKIKELLEQVRNVRLARKRPRRISLKLNEHQARNLHWLLWTCSYMGGGSSNSHTSSQEGNKRTPWNDEVLANLEAALQAAPEDFCTSPPSLPYAGDDTRERTWKDYLLYVKDRTSNPGQKWGA